MLACPARGLKSRSPATRPARRHLFPCISKIYWSSRSLPRTAHQKQAFGLTTLPSRTTLRPKRPRNDNRQITSFISINTSSRPRVLRSRDVTLIRLRLKCAPLSAMRKSDPSCTTSKILDPYQITVRNANTFPASQFGFLCSCDQYSLTMNTNQASRTMEIEPSAMLQPPALPPASFRGQRGSHPAFTVWGLAVDRDPLFLRTSQSDERRPSSRSFKVTSLSFIHVCALHCKI